MDGITATSTAEKPDMFRHKDNSTWAICMRKMVPHKGRFMEIRHLETTGKRVLAMVVADQVVHLHSTVEATIMVVRTAPGEVMVAAFIVLVAAVAVVATVWVAVAVVAIVAEEDDKIFFSVY